MPRERLLLENDEGLEVEIPSKYEVCDRCGGKGVHDHPAFSNGITASEWNGPDWDDDSREGYLAGRYDVRCSECSGARVVLVADEKRLSEEERKLWERHLDFRAELAHEARLRERGIEY